MILLLDTSTPVCKLSLVDGEWRHDTSWESGRELAKGLLQFIQDQLESQGRGWGDISGLVIFKGPGSFTGLRIGVTVMNSLAYAHSLPIVGEMTEAWQALGVARIVAGENDQIVMPEYGGEANITTPRK